MMSLSLDANGVPRIYRVKVISPDENDAVIFETTRMMLESDVPKVRQALIDAYFHGARIDIYPA